MYDEFLRIIQDHVPFNEAFITSLLQDVMPTSQSHLPLHIQKDTDITVVLQTLFILLTNHPLLCTTSSLPGSSKTPRECIPLRLPFSFDSVRLRIQRALFTQDNCNEWNTVLTKWLLNYYEHKMATSDPAVIIIPVITSQQALTMAVPPEITTLYTDNRQNTMYSLQGLIVDDGASIYQQVSTKVEMLFKISEYGPMPSHYHLMPVYFPSKPWTILIYVSSTNRRTCIARSNNNAHAAMTEVDDDCSSVPSFSPSSITKEVVDDFSYQDDLTPLDDDSLQHQLENVIHAAMLRQKLSSSLGRPHEAKNPPSLTSSSSYLFKRRSTKRSKS